MLYAVRSYESRLQKAFADRSTSRSPPTRNLLFLAVGGLVSYILLAMVLVPKAEPPEYHFFDERGAVTVLSAMLLAVGSGWAFVICYLQGAEGGMDQCFWRILTLALGFLSLDELLEFHEIVGRRLYGWCGSPLGGMLRNWNDAIVILYGVGAIVFLLLFLPCVLRIPKLAEMFGVAIVFFGIHTLIDATQEPPSSASIILEETAKLFCSGFLAIASLMGLLGTLQPRRSGAIAGTG